MAETACSTISWLVSELERLGHELERLDGQLEQVEAQRRRQRLEAARVPGWSDALMIEEHHNYVKAGGLGMARVFFPISRLTKVANKLLVEAEGAASAPLLGAFNRAANLALGQMGNADLAPAGRLIGAQLDGKGVLVIKAEIDDRVAARKAYGKIYPGLLVEIEAGEITEISLVDRPFEKSGGPDRLLAKIFGKENRMTALASALRKCEDRRLGKTVQALSAGEREALMAVPGVRERLARLERVEIGGSDPRTEKQATEDALTLVRAALARPISGDPRFTIAR